MNLSHNNSSILFITIYVPANNLHWLSKLSQCIRYLLEACLLRSLCHCASYEKNFVGGKHTQSSITLLLSSIREKYTSQVLDIFGGIVYYNIFIQAYQYFHSDIPTCSGFCSAFWRSWLSTSQHFSSFDRASCSDVSVSSKNSFSSSASFDNSNLSTWLKIEKCNSHWYKYKTQSICIVYYKIFLAVNSDTKQIG